MTQRDALLLLPLSNDMARWLMTLVRSKSTMSHIPGTFDYKVHSRLRQLLLSGTVARDQHGSPVDEVP